MAQLRKAKEEQEMDEAHKKEVALQGNPLLHIEEQSAKVGLPNKTTYVVDPYADSSYDSVSR